MATRVERRLTSVVFVHEGQFSFADAILSLPAVTNGGSLEAINWYEEGFLS